MFFKTSFSSQGVNFCRHQVRCKQMYLSPFSHSLSSQRVFVWDLDETIIIFHSLLTGTFASRYGKVRIMLSLCFSLFFFSITVCPAGLSWELWGQLVRQLLQQMLPLCITPGLRSPIEFSLDMWKFNQLPPLSALPFLPTHETVNIHLIGCKLVVFACLPPPKRARRCFSQTQES